LLLGSILDRHPQRPLFPLHASSVFISALASLVARVFWMAHLADGHFTWFALFGAVSTIVTTGSGLVGLSYFSQAMENLIAGVTAVKLFLRRPIVRTGRSCDHCEEICGPRILSCCWCCPFCICLEPQEDGFYPDVVPASSKQDDLSRVYQTGDEPSAARKTQGSSRRIFVRNCAVPSKNHSNKNKTF
jgi:hypothetical protein